MQTFLAFAFPAAVMVFATQIIIGHYDTRYCTKHVVNSAGRLRRNYGMWPRTPGPQCDGPRHRNKWTGR